MPTGPLLRAVNSAIRAAGATKSPENAALVALARTYARLLDEASAVAAAAAAIPTPADGNDRQALDALRRRVAEQATVAELGPRLLTTLTALKLAPAVTAPTARTASLRAAKTADSRPDPADTLASLRARAAARMSRIEGPSTA